MIKFFLTVALVILSLAIGSILFAISGFYDIGADTPHWTVTRQFLQMVRERSIAARSGIISIPDLTNEQRILKGAGQYAAMCASCHSAPGKAETAMGEGLYPKAPLLASTRLDERAVFWVVKHGVKMTGMPAWGKSHGDEAIWDTVAFVMKLRGMSGVQYDEIIAKASPDDDMQKPGMQMPSTSEGDAHGARHQR